MLAALDGTVLICSHLYSVDSRKERLEGDEKVKLSSLFRESGLCDGKQNCKVPERMCSAVENALAVSLYGVQARVLVQARFICVVVFLSSFYRIERCSPVRVNC